MQFKQSTYDSCIYVAYAREGVLYIAVFVDDHIFTTHPDLYSALKEELLKHFPIKDLGEVRKCLGLNITRDRTRNMIKLEQRNHIDAIIKNFYMTDCKPVSTPMEPAVNLNVSTSPVKPEDIERLKRIPYQSAVGALLYIYRGTRPDLAYAVSTISKFNNNYDETHWSAVKRVIKYLKGTRDIKLIFLKQTKPDLEGYSDASWATDPEDARSVTGYIFLMQGGAISWNCKRQSTVATSSTEAEYQALAAATQELIWLRGLTIELVMQESTPHVIHCDNKGAIDLATNTHFSPRTKHVKVKHHFIKEKIDQKEIQVLFTSSETMLAEALTKPVSSSKLKAFLHHAGLMNI